MNHQTQTLKPNRMKILLIDNYDSFTYNLRHLLEPLVERVDVVLNDEFPLADTMNYDAVVFSPGPGLPADAGVMPQMIHEFHTRIPMLGICLGMQAMAEYFGGRLSNLENVLHGLSQTCHVIHPEDELYRGLPATFEVGHYHSWIVKDVPECLKVSAVHKDGWPLSFTHRNHKMCGVQYHPESVMTSHGPQLLQNWVNSLKISQPEISAYEEVI